MISRIRLLFILLALATYVGCDNVEFSEAPFSPIVTDNETCQQVGVNVECSGTITAGVVDILFVDDNSGSMYQEQEEMATKFPNFINSIQNLNYHIAITTTDISGVENPPDSANLFGDLQDGQLIAFPNGSKVISKNTHNAISEFQNTIARKETDDCDNNSATCPSGDERAIFAINKALDNGNTEFFRGDGHFAVVILSDEDERSNGGNFTGYAFEDYDRPETLVQKLGSVFSSTKTMSVHAVVIKPKENESDPDTDCFIEQNSQPGVKGFYANTYKQLTNPSDSLKTQGNIIEGHLGSICADDYGIELGDIASKLKDNINRIQLKCNPIADTLSVTFNPAPASPITFDVNSDNQIVLTPAAPAGTKVSYDYDCLLGDLR